MTAPLFNNSNGAFANVVDGYVYPQFIGYANRAPTTQDIYPPGTRWQDNSVNPAVIYQTTGAGVWYSDASSGGSFTSLTVTGTTTLTGTTNINTSGSAVTTIGTGGTGAVNIGNATGNTAVTGSLTASTGLVATTGGVTATAGALTATNGNLVLGTAGNKLSIATGANASVGVSGAMTAGTITISTTAVTASSKIFLTIASVGGTPGVLSVGTITAGTSFVINSSSGTDTSTVNWLIIN